MDSTTGVLSLIIALIATSDALLCTKCTSTFPSRCTGSSETCPAGFLCASSITESNAGGIDTVFVRSCAPPSECGFVGSVGVPQGQIRQATTCCSSDFCTPLSPQFFLPAFNYTYNGLTCRYCVSDKSTWCYTSDTVLCTGDHTKCMLHTTQAAGGRSTAIRGCSTKSFCDLGSRSQTVDGVKTEVKIFCTDSGISVHEAVWALAITSLLLIKFFS